MRGAVLHKWHLKVPARKVLCLLSPNWRAREKEEERGWRVGWGKDTKRINWPIRTSFTRFTNLYPELAWGVRSMEEMPVCTLICRNFDLFLFWEAGFSSDVWYPQEVSYPTIRILIPNSATSSSIKCGQELPASYIVWEWANTQKHPEQSLAHSELSIIICMLLYNFAYIIPLDLKNCVRFCYSHKTQV